MKWNTEQGSRREVGVADENVQTKSKLAMCLEQYQATYVSLCEAYASYQEVRELLEALREDPQKVGDLPLTLKVGNLQVPLTNPPDAQSREALVEDALAFLGTEVVGLWNAAHRVTTEAVEHCEAAVRQAETHEAAAQ